MSDASIAKPSILYLSHAPDDLYAVMRRLAEPDMDLVTLESDSDRERMDKLSRVDAVIVAAYRFSQPLIAAAKGLRLVHHQGVGYQDTIDLEALNATGARLAITPSGTTTGVAEHTLLLTLAVLRRLAYADAELRRGQWHINALRPESRELSGKTVGYIGMGRIGQAAARRFRAFETTGLYYDPVVVLDAAAEAELGLRKASFDEVLRAADVLTLHVPLTADTHHLIDATGLSRMQPGAIIINTARGPLIDEAALVAALQQGAISGAGLDVFETEPPPSDSPLMTMRNTVLSPHISAGTLDAFEAKMGAVFANLRRFFAGAPLENEIRLP